MGKKKGGKGKGPKANINVPALVCTSLGCLLLCISIALPDWLSNPSGLNYYPFPRSWGLWRIVGRRSVDYYDSWVTQCKIAATTAVDMVCITPLCRWYEAKCSAYRMQAAISYSTGCVLILLIPFALGACIFSIRRKTQNLKWATSLSFLVVLIPAVMVAAYISVMSTSFDIINSAGYYPVPQPSIAMFILGGAEFFFFCALIANCVRGRKVKKELDFEEDTFYDVAMFRAEHGL